MYIPFSQRNGLASMPPQLQLGEVSDELRQLIDYYLSLEIERNTKISGYGSVFSDCWCRISSDFHVLFIGKSFEEFENCPYNFKKYIRIAINKLQYGKLFDFVEFFVRHSGCSDELKSDLAKAFVTSRAAYRIVDHSHIVALGTDEQADAYQ